MGRISGKIANSWLVCLSGIVLAVGLAAAVILIVHRFPLWWVAVMLAAGAVAVTGAGLFSIFVLALKMLRAK